MNRKFYFFILLFVVTKVSAQVVQMSPSFAGRNDNITITFDASLGNMELKGQSVVYAHTGVITEKSSTSTDWKYVQGTWGTDDTKVKMTSIGNNKFTLSYNIAAFYGVPASEKILKLAFVFRNQNGSLVGRNADGSDIFVPISSGDFQILFQNPTSKNTILNNGDSILVKAITSAKAHLKLYLNDSLVNEKLADSLISYSYKATEVKNYKVKLVAVYHAVSYADSVSYVVRNIRIQNAPLGVVDGINYINDSTVILQLFAPYKSFVYAIGDFSDWYPDTAYDMVKTPDGLRFWTTIRSLIPGKEYRFQYLIDQVQLKVADPYADKLLDPYNDHLIPSSVYPNLIGYPVGKTTEYVSVFQTAQPQYNWQHSAGFTKPSKSTLNIYELLVRDFTTKHDYQSIIDTLNYLQNLGINAIELMPVNEFEGNESWGYNTIFYFAPDKYYGPKDKLKLLVDECHKRGIAVIFDMVLNHNFGQSSFVRMYFDASTGKPAANSPWFNVDPTHPFNVGYDFNHESPYTKALVDTVIQYWVREFKMDGFRFDLSKGFTQKYTGSDVGAMGAYDPSRVAIWKRIYDKFQPTCSDCYMILEHFADNQEQTILSNYGFMLWGNMNYPYNQATMGYSSDLNGSSYKQFGWADPNLVVYMESHDEERLQYKNVNFGYSNSTYDAKDSITALSRNEAAAVIHFSVPGPKMIWQFGELGYDYSINYCTNGTISDACRLANKPIKWDYLQNPYRHRLHDVYKAMMDIRTQTSGFNTKDFSHTLTGNYKIVRLNDSNLKVLTIANMGVTDNAQKPLFQQSGWWYEYFTGDSIYIEAKDTLVRLKPAEYRVYTSARLTKPSITPVSVNEINSESKLFEIFPNPANNELYILVLSKENKLTQINLYNLTGQSIHSGTYLNPANNTFELQTSDLQSGLYLLHVKSDNKIESRKILIQH